MVVNRQYLTRLFCMVFLILSVVGCAQIEQIIQPEHVGVYEDNSWGITTRITLFSDHATIQATFDGASVHSYTLNGTHVILENMNTKGTTVFEVLGNYHALKQGTRTYLKID